MCRLRFFEIHFDFGYASEPDYDRDFRILSVLMGSLFMSLTSPATLEHLEFNIRFDSISEGIFYENLRNADVWSYLDSITTYPTSSRLRRVDININYFVYEEDEDGDEDVENEILKVVLDGLPLLRTKGILFVKAEYKHWSSA